MSKQLPVKWQPAWVSHLGCIKGCLDYLGIPVSAAWLYGGTGHAFILNVHSTGCPSGPTAWRTRMLVELGNNLGYIVSGVCGYPNEADFERKQRAAYEHVKAALEQGHPCYAWELDIPEFYVINGVDETGYYFNGPGVPGGHKPWTELGKDETMMLEAYSVEPGYSADDKTVVKEALQFVLEHGDNPEKWTYPEYKSGLAGYDNWIQAVRTEQELMGLAYNAAVWHECRQLAVGFLQEAAERLGGELAKTLHEAEQHYRVVAEQLQQVARIYPFPPKDEQNDAEKGEAAAKCLRAARAAEEQGLGVLRKLLSQLS